ncbi:addiction module protein [Flavobacterium sp. TSSA_36]|uniref:addiction module protein n=1 Tax=Flavobacterium sp. TSSA_36 TaxID=3447669 RepID=UPI003F36E8E7
MEAIRQFIDVKDNAIQVALPEGFTARRVEVIILPSEVAVEDELPQWQKEILDARLDDYYKNPTDVMDFDKMIEAIEKRLL